jgi:hypothetical protein
MRVALVVASLVVAASISISLWATRTAGCPLTITPAGDPQFHFPEEGRTDIAVVSLPVAVTNNTRSKLLVCVDVARATRLLDGSPNPFRIWKPEGVDPQSRDAARFTTVREPLELKPKAGALCTVRYMRGEPLCILGADYCRPRHSLEARVRLLLHTCGLRWIRTNDVWHTLQVARIEQH